LRRPTSSSTKGFTIVELLIVIVVIGILAAITIVSFNGVNAKAKTAKAQADASSIIKKLELYRSLALSAGDGYPLPNQAHQHWYNMEQSDMSTSDPLTKLPSNLRVVRGDDNSKDTAADWTLVSTHAFANPTEYAFVVCSDITTGIQTGVKVAYPNFSTQSVAWLRTGSCPEVPPNAP
jgi:prepilin-type N-terminal cleavage/methylation domain-containing protein